MDSIWSFLLHTLNVSLVAGLLLLLKWLLKDKLSPRWQYAVWGVLALRILIPSSLSRSILLPLPLWLETCKGLVEAGSNSAYCSVYEPISTSWNVSIQLAAPNSITDWCYMIYLIGVALILGRYTVSYIRLRLLLRKGLPGSDALQAKLDHICSTYGLDCCRVIQLPGLPAPFVCGLICPVLAVPADKEIDDKVLLHELLHLKHRDPWQTIGWTLLRAFHWCNPFLTYVFDRIGNDMEALCDQRVLEHLEGEDRRSYGLILLQMANERYARAPGTSSVSNGGKNISRRIEAIARFKLYPRGMSLVSICILIALLGPTLIGTVNAFNQELFLPSDSVDLPRSMAAARITRCTTVAGALDTYAKGLIMENGLYLAAASPLSKHEDLAAELYRNCTKDDWVAYHLDSGWELDYVVQQDGYAVFNLEPGVKNSYLAVLGFSVSAFLNEDGVGWRTDDEGSLISGSVLIPVSVWNDRGDWVVVEQGPRTISYEPLDQQQYLDAALQPTRVLTAVGKSGTVSVKNVVIMSINNMAQTSFFGASYFDSTPKPDAQFSSCNIWDFITYQYDPSTPLGHPDGQVGIQIQQLQIPDASYSFDPFPLQGSSGRSSNDGYAAQSERIGSSWDGTVFSGSGNWYGDEPFNLEEALNYPKGYAVQVVWDHAPVEEFILQEVTP